MWDLRVRMEMPPLQKNPLKSGSCRNGTDGLLTGKVIQVKTRAAVEGEKKAANRKESSKIWQWMQQVKGSDI